MELRDEERTALLHMAEHHGGRSREARRARIILLLAEGRTVGEVCSAINVTHQTVCAWRRRFAALGLAGLKCPVR